MRGEGRESGDNGREARRESGNGEELGIREARRESSDGGRGEARGDSVATTRS